MYSSSYVWAKILSHVENTQGPSWVSSWFDDIEVVELNDSQLILHSPSPFRKEIIEKHCADTIQEAMLTVFGSKVDVVVISTQELETYRSKGKDNTVMDFNPQFTFDNYIVGSSNRLAHSAARAVANNPGAAYNPLYIYGPSGVGKTHLLYAIANELRRKNPNYRIVYIKGDQFTNELVAAIGDGRNMEFRSKYREADLFLIDDIQFIAGKERTQEEFFHTFNTLYEAHKQIVMTSDRTPSDMLTLEDRLRTRFEWGLLVDVQPPDYETRMAILKNKALSLGLELPDDVLAYIANNITNNVRQLEGTVKKILAYRDLNNMPIDLPNVSRAINDMFKVDTGTVPTPALIISQVSRFYSIDESVLRGSVKKKEAVIPRQVAMYLIRNLTNLSLPEIGKEFGKDHSTVIHSIRKVEMALKDPNSPLIGSIQDITANVNSSL